MDATERARSIERSILFRVGQLIVDRLGFGSFGLLDDSTPKSLLDATSISPLRQQFCDILVGPDSRRVNTRDGD